MGKFKAHVATRVLRPAPPAPRSPRPLRVLFLLHLSVCATRVAAAAGYTYSNSGLCGSDLVITKRSECKAAYESVKNDAWEIKNNPMVNGTGCVERKAVCCTENDRFADMTKSCGGGATITTSGPGGCSAVPEGCWIHGTGRLQFNPYDSKKNDLRVYAWFFKAKLGLICKKKNSTRAPTVNPTASPTTSPTRHGCDQVNQTDKKRIHTCHKGKGGHCVRDSTKYSAQTGTWGWKCACTAGYVCTAGCDKAHKGHTCNLTSGPTQVPTRAPTTAGPTTRGPTAAPTAVPTRPRSASPTASPTTGEALLRASRKEAAAAAAAAASRHSIVVWAGLSVVIVLVLAIVGMLLWHSRSKKPVVSCPEVPPPPPRRIPLHQAIKFCVGTQDSMMSLAHWCSHSVHTTQTC